MTAVIEQKSAVVVLDSVKGEHIESATAIQGVPDLDLASMEKFDRLEADILKFPQLEIEPVHYFADGLYAREITIPPGALLTGKVHKTQHFTVLSSGDATVWSEEHGVRRIKAPITFVAAIGSRRVIFAHTETVWTTFHVNPENKTDVDELEDDLIYDYMNHLIDKEVQEWLS